MTPAEAAVAINEIEVMIAEMKEYQTLAADPVMLLRIGYQLDALRTEQKYLIGLILREG